MELCGKPVLWCTAAILCLVIVLCGGATPSPSSLKGSPGGVPDIRTGTASARAVSRSSSGALTLSDAEATRSSPSSTDAGEAPSASRARPTSEPASKPKRHRRRRQRKSLPPIWSNRFNATRYKEQAQRMFDFAYDNYMKHAFPLDELDPIHCRGRGADPNLANININDVLGNYSLTLIDSLDTLAVMDNKTRFKDAVRLVIDKVDFDKDSTVQVFEATIRVLGGLLSAHQIVTDRSFNVSIDDYDGELLLLARDLGNRLLPAFDVAPTGLPYPRVNLRHGLVRGPKWRNDTCTAAVGTLLIEFTTLSRLTGDPVFEAVARRALRSLLRYRSTRTGLLGSSIDVRNGKWINTMAGLGAGSDSLYEYLFKAYVLFGDEEYMELFKDAFLPTVRSTRLPFAPINVNVDMHSGMLSNNWIDSLQAYLPALMTLAGDPFTAAGNHALYFAIWRKYGAFPDRFDWVQKMPSVSVYPLRPELAEATYALYRATRDRFYQRVAAQMLMDIRRHTKVKCGFATLHDVMTKEKEDRMESFFLSETLKYLYLTLDDDNILHTKVKDIVFSTEGHIFLPTPQLRHTPSDISRVQLLDDTISRALPPSQTQPISSNALTTKEGPLAPYETALRASIVFPQSEFESMTTCPAIPWQYQLWGLVSDEILNRAHAVVSHP